jgi:uncharacterized lipoprotein YmbA
MRRSLLVLGLLLAACTILEPQPDTSRFFTLSAVAQSPDGVAPSSLAVGVGPVRVPAYLDRPELATRVASSEVSFSPNERWAEPLSASLRRVLAENLATVLGTNEIVFFPWPAGTPVDWGVSLDVIRFERTKNGEVEVTARWAVREKGTGRIRTARETRHTQQANGSGAAADVDAWNQAIAALSADIAAAIDSLGSPHLAP